LIENTLSNLGAFKQHAPTSAFLNILFVMVIVRVCGFEKDMTKSFIYYISFYTEEDLREFSKISQDSFNVSGALGGLIIIV
jgi:hypothetical protein